MSKKKEEDGFQGIDIVSSNLTQAKANKLRSAIVMELKNKWVYVVKPPSKKTYDVAVANVFGGRLPKDELTEVKEFVKNFKY